MFTQTFEGGIDARGRMVVPSSFRAELGGSSRFFVFPALDGEPYLEGGGDALMEDYDAIISQMPPHDPDAEALQYAIFSRCAEITMDQAGRATLPQNLRDLAGIETTIAFVGKRSGFQLWSPALLKDHEADMLARAKEARTRLAGAFNQARSSGLLSGQRS